jgi:hypothetical protein
MVLSRLQIMRTILFILTLVSVCNAFAQDPLADFRMKMEAQRIELERRRADSISKLRESIINLREVRQKSCQFRTGPDCYLAEISSIELALLNLEDFYRLAETRAQSDARKTNYKKIQEVTNSIRSEVDELAKLVDKADR